MVTAHIVLADTFSSPNSHILTHTHKFTKRPTYMQIGRSVRLTSYPPTFSFFSWDFFFLYNVEGPSYLFNTIISKYFTGVTANILQRKSASYWHGSARHTQTSQTLKPSWRSCELGGGGYHWCVSLNSPLFSPFPADYKEWDEYKPGLRPRQTQRVQATSQQISQWLSQIYVAVTKAKAGSSLHQNGYLSSTITVKDPKYHKACVFVNVSVLRDQLHTLAHSIMDQQRRRRGFTESFVEDLLLLSTLKHIGPFAHLFSQSLHGGGGGSAICHTAQSHIMHTTYMVYEQKTERDTRSTTKKKDWGMSMQWPKHRHTHTHTNTVSCPLFCSCFLPWQTAW